MKIRKIRNWIAALLFVTSVGGATLAIATPQTTFAACNDRLLTFPAWFKGLTDGKCEIKKPGNGTTGLSTFIWTIVLNIVEMGLQLVGYLSVAFIIRGGYKYMTAIGEAGEIEKAKTIIKNAVIGLIISILSVAIVNFIADAIN
jgi:type IV secretion system pilin